MSENTENTNLVSFWSFLENNTIEIPKIQRDYAQGREGKEDLRKKFLAKLKEVLEEGKVQTLDFVYGAEKGGKIHVLDGQQRLTTLWLLHWYVALRAGKLNDDCKTLKKFTYETRVSSSDFCKNLCNSDNFKSFKGNNIVDFIQDQTWFYSEWKQDPTISSMLRMLGKSEKDSCIEDVFHDAPFGDYWKKLKTKRNCPFVFYYLSLGEFRLSDDLYIKMNARGKPLTSFENLKADLIGYIEDKATKELEGKEKEKESWEKLKENLPQKLDTDWTDIFWKNKFRENEEVRIDEIYFAFINRFFWNELFVAKKPGTEDYIIEVSSEDKEENSNVSYGYLNKDDCDEYSEFDLYCFQGGKIPLTLFKDLETILDNYSDSEYAKDKKLPCAKWIKDFDFIPKYTKDKKNNKVTVEKLNQRHRILFFSLCKYFREGKADKTTLERWMRVVCNLVSGKDGNGGFEIRSTESMRRAIEFIDELDSHNVYKSLVEKYPFDDKNKSAFDQRCKEEIIKAKKILEDVKWGKKFIEAEKYAFFNGAIRFLYQNEEGKEDWSHFDEKWAKVQSLFADNAEVEEDVDDEDEKNKNKDYRKSCLKEDGAKLLKTLISFFKIEKGKAKIFGEVIGEKNNKSNKTLDNAADSWRYYLLNNKLYEPIDNLLLGKKKIELKKEVFNNKSFEKNDSSEKLQYLFVNTGLLDEILKKYPGSRIHYYRRDNSYAIFVERRDNGVMLEEKEGRKKIDEFLLSSDKVKIDKEYHQYKGYEKGYPLLGFNRYFKFKGRTYFWDHKDDCIYLQPEDNPYDENHDENSEHISMKDMKNKSNDKIIVELKNLQKK